MHPLAQFDFQLSELALHFLSHRLPLYRELAPSRLAADVRKAKEVEGFRFVVATTCSAFGGKPAEFNQPCLVRMQLQFELLQSLRKFFPELLGFDAILESDHNIVGVTHDDHIATSCLPPPFVGPEIKRIMQIDVGQ